MIFSTSRHYFPTFQPQNKSPKQSFQPPPSQWSLCPLPHERAEWSDLLRARHEYGAYLSCCSSGEMFPIWIREMLHLKKKQMFGDFKKCWFPANVLLNQSIQNRSVHDFPNLPVSLLPTHIPLGWYFARFRFPSRKSSNAGVQRSNVQKGGAKWSWDPD